MAITIQNNPPNNGNLPKQVPKPEGNPRPQLKKAENPPNFKLATSFFIIVLLWFTVFVLLEPTQRNECVLSGSIDPSFITNVQRKIEKMCCHLDDLQVHETNFILSTFNGNASDISIRFFDYKENTDINWEFDCNKAAHPSLCLLLSRKLFNAGARGPDSLEVIESLGFKKESERLSNMTSFKCGGIKTVLQLFFEPGQEQSSRSPAITLTFNTSTDMNDYWIHHKVNSLTDALSPWMILENVKCSNKKLRV